MAYPFARKTGFRDALMLCLVLAAFAAAFYKTARQPAPAAFQMPIVQPPGAATQAPNAAPEAHTYFVSTQHNIHTHAASLVELGDGRIRAFWFAGSREGAPDVEIRSAVFDPTSRRWGAEHSIANRLETQRGLLRYVKKLGNPVALRAADGTLWLFYVTVSLGGWAGSSITAIASKDDGATWSPARRLVTSPFINISTLVKSAPFFYSDGSFGLPVYHEFIGKFGELLRLSASGEIIDKQRLSSGKTTLQPVMLIQNPRQATVLMRYSGLGPRRVVTTATGDAGQHWSTPAKTALANPDAALSGIVLPDGRILLALNDTEEARNSLSLAVSGDGGATWKTILQLEDQRAANTDPERYKQLAIQTAKATDNRIGDATPHAESARRNKCKEQSCIFEFSYPYLIQARNGDFHLVYTWNRSYIKHVRFTRAWLDQRMELATDAKLH